MISNINNGESGSSARTKINAVIDQANVSILNLPRNRYIYLVSDTADATELGGSAKNAYTTAQAAYDAANTLQVSLGSTSVVVVIVGNTASTRTSPIVFATTVGDITLTADYNTNIIFMGQSHLTSVIGNIIGTNSSGNGYSIGGSTLSALFYNITFSGGISSNATGTTGNSGNIGISGYNFVVQGAITTEITNASNTTGNAGAFNLSSSNISSNLNSQGVKITSINTSLPSGSSGNSGAVQIVSDAYIGSITIANMKTSAFQYFFGNKGKLTIASFIASTTVSCTVMSFANCIFDGAVTITTSSTMLLTNIEQKNGSTINIQNNGSGATTVRAIGCSYLGTTVTTNQNTSASIVLNASTPIIAKNCSFPRFVNMGINSKLINCDFEAYSAVPVINGIGTGCTFYNCSIIGGTFCIDNGSAVSVAFTSKFSSYEAAPGANVTLT